MGVPKFFRWISERYPLINQTIDFENAGPVFGKFFQGFSLIFKDCLYLDMNGIIHGVYALETTLTFSLYTSF